MKTTTTKLACEKLAMVISLKQKGDNYLVVIKETKNTLSRANNVYNFEYRNYGDALNKYVSVVEEEANHIALMSL